MTATCSALAPLVPVNQDVWFWKVSVFWDSPENPSSSDPKAELFHYTADFLKKLGYEVLVLDFKNPEKSMRYNLLQPIIDAISEGDTDRAEMLAWDLTNNLVGKPEGEKIWTNGECSIIAAAILCVVCDNQKRPEFQNMTNVYWFISEMCRTIGNKMPLLEYVKKLSPSHPARALLSISDVAPSRTCSPRSPSTRSRIPVILPLQIWAAKSRRCL